MSTWEARHLLSPSPTFLIATDEKAGPSQLSPPLPLKIPGELASCGPGLPSLLKTPLLTAGSLSSTDSVFETVVGDKPVIRNA